MIWLAIIKDEVLGFIKMTKGVKITSATYPQILESASLP